jgi:hypothetical protein
MHLKVFLKLKKTLKPSLLGKKTQKNTKKTHKKTKKPTGLVFFVQPCLAEDVDWQLRAAHNSPRRGLQPRRR